MVFAMKSGRVQAVFDVLAIMAIAFTGLGWLAEARGWLDPHPFVDVRDVSIEYSGGLYLIEATYTKTDADCEFVPPIAVFGWTFGQRLRLDNEPIRQVGQTSDRIEGQQLMVLEVEAWEPVDRIEVWVRHNCQGRRVDTLMVDRRF